MKLKTKILLVTIVSSISATTGLTIGFLTNKNTTKTSAVISKYSYDSDTPFFNAYFDTISIDNTASLDRWYDDETVFPFNTNTSNFCSLGTTSFENINNKTVTVDAFNRNQTDNLNDPNFGQSMLIYQCIQYKVAHPETEMYIDFASYRLSITASACLRRDSKFFGYMRSLFNEEYNDFGFVRMAFTLVEAARMGIHVTMTPQLNSYAVQQYSSTDSSGHASIGEPSYVTYFNSALSKKCYSSYAPNKKVSDFLVFKQIKWNVEEIGQDMQHVKTCTVSHYLDFHGNEHENAVFFESSNVDAITYLGRNGNGGSQTGVIVTNHEDLFRCTHNFVKLMANYSEKNDVTEFRRIARSKSQKQIDLINSGLQNTIPSNEQIVYLGSSNDNVFELYFSPFGGNVATWDKTYNPFCKYISEFKKSDGPIVFTWTLPYVDYGHAFDYTMEDMIAEAFHDNKNPKNRIYLHVPGFNEKKYNDLKVGTDIGFKYVNQNLAKYLHSKDVIMSYYVGEYHKYVSLISSCNFGYGPYWYRTNSTLVIKENENNHGVYHDLGVATTYGCIE